MPCKTIQFVPPCNVRTSNLHTLTTSAHCTNVNALESTDFTRASNLHTETTNVYLYTYLQFKALLDIQCLTLSSVIFICRRSPSVITTATLSNEEDRGNAP